MRAMAGTSERAVVRSSIEERRELFVLYEAEKHEKLDLRSVGEWTE